MEGVRDGAAPPREIATAASPARVAAFRTGVSAENRAAAFLMAKGYRILAKRFRTPYGEIDLVAKKRDENGRWPLENPHPGPVHFEMEGRAGEPSRWNTLRALRVLRWAGAL